MTDPGTLTFLLLVAIASIPGYWVAATLTDLARRKSDQRRRDHITDTAYNLSAADIATHVCDWSFDADQQAVWDAHCRNAVAQVRGDDDALDLLANAEDKRADWSQVEKWGAR